MTYDDANDHASFRESIAAALAGGLSAAEQSAFDAHRAACPACAAEFDRAKESEDHMTALLAPALPAVGFEDRLIQRLRETAPAARRLHFAPPNWRIHSALGKAVAGIAAAIVLGGVGYAVTGALEEAPPARSAANLPQVGEASNDNRPAIALQDGRGLANRFDAEGKSFAQDAPFVSGYAFNGSKRLNQNFGSDFSGVADAKKSSSDDLADLTVRNREAGAPVNSHAAVAGKPSVAVNTGGVSLGVEGTTVAGEPMVEAEIKQQISRGEELSTLSHEAITRSSAVAPADSRWFKPTQLARVQHGAVDVDGDGAVDVGRSSGGTPTFNLQQQQQHAAGAVPTAAAPAVADGPAPAQMGTSPKTPQPAPVSGEKPGADYDVLGRRVLVAANVAQAPPVAAEPVRQAQPTTRKVIRNGELAFEVDRFDSAFAQVSKLTTEAGGYVGTTSSEKLPNGKVQGKVTVRLPPDRLDTLILQLRGIGDLKSQSLEAQDVSKKYTDLESQLRAARAMEERLIGIIKEGKGQIKDLLAAEKELGNWRTKVEELTGEMKYYDNLVSLATLNLTLTERDIETPATAYESENIDAGVESEDVESARAAALKAIEEAKGRVVQSDLKRYDAGQFGATIVAEVPPDAAGPLLDRLKQIGKVARLDVQRKQTADAKKPNAATHAPVRIEKRDTRFNLSIYNLANVAPRQTATLNLAADDVEKAYQAILDRVAKAGGRIVSSNLNRQKPEQTTGTIAFEVPTTQAEAVTNDLRAAGESMKLTVTENPDVQNVTTAKRGFNVSLIAIAAVAPRETTTIQLAAADVAQAREKILAVAGAQAAHVRASQLNENDRQNITASLELDVKRTALPAVEKALADAGQIVRRNVARSADAENTLDTKVRLSMTLLPADRLPPRETTTLTVELKDVESAMASLQAAAIEAGGRVVLSNLAKDRDGRGIAKVAVDVPLGKSGEIVRRTRELGAVRAIDASKDLQVPPGGLARARIDVTFANADTLVAPEHGVFASIRRGLSTSLEGLMMSLQLIIVGICFVLPWALVLYAIWRFIKRRRSRSEPATLPAPA